MSLRRPGALREMLSRKQSEPLCANSFILGEKMWGWRVLVSVSFLSASPHFQGKAGGNVFNPPRRGESLIARDFRRRRPISTRRICWVARRTNPPKPETQRGASRQDPRGPNELISQRVIGPSCCDHLSRGVTVYVNDDQCRRNYTLGDGRAEATAYNASAEMRVAPSAGAWSTGGALVSGRIAPIWPYSITGKRAPRSPQSSLRP